MAYVDDVRTTFDAADFCSTVRAGVGEGKISSGLALRDSRAASAALAALRAFHEHAVSPHPPDVIHAYLQYSPAANELFTALRAASSHRVIASAALDCLTAVVRYSLDDSNPPPALEATRSVTKEVVKGRAVLIYDVFVNDSRACAKKALNLLRLVAQCHPILAKEIVNRFNLGADVMASALCSEENNYCRVPFLDLLFVLLASGDFDVANSLATRSRKVLVGCLKVIKQRTLKESNENHPDVLPDQERQQKKRVKRYSTGKEKGQSRNAKEDLITPSHVQKRELIAAINLLLAIERHILWTPNQLVRRSAFAYPLPELLSAIAAADMPPLKVAPRQVTPEHEALRASSATLFIAVATDSRIHNIPDIVSALNQTAGVDSKAAVNFVLRVIEEQPKVCKRLLETGPYLSSEPMLTSAWLGYAAIISACVLRLSSATARFIQTRFFEKALLHAEALVRHTGGLIMLAFCKVVARDKAAATEAQRFLPPIRVIERMLDRFPEDEQAQKLAVAHQTLFEGDADEARLNVLKLPGKATGDDDTLSEDAVRAALKMQGQNAAEWILRRRQWSNLVVFALRTNDRRASARTWGLCRDVLRCADIFPRGTEAEIEVYLAILSSMGPSAKECSKGLEALACDAIARPYGLYDETRKWEVRNKDAADLTGLTCETSLLSVLAVHHLRKLDVLKDLKEKKIAAIGSVLEGMLLITLQTIVGCRKLMGAARDGAWLESVIPIANGMSNGDLPCPSESHFVIRIVHRLFSHGVKYPHTPYLQLIRGLASSSLRSALPSAEDTDNCVEAGLLWKAWHKFRISREYSALADTISSFPFDVGHRGLSTETSTVSISLLLEKMNRGDQDELRLYHDAMAIRGGLDGCDAVLFVAMVLRKASNLKRYNAFVDEAVGFLSRKDSSADKRQLVSFVQDAVLTALGQGFGLRELQINSLLSFAINSLTRESSVSFAVSLLMKMVLHADQRISLHSRRCLAEEHEVMVCSWKNLSFRCAIELANLLQFFPAAQRSAISQAERLSVTDLKESLPQALPVLRKLVNADLFTAAKERLGFDREALCNRVVQAVRDFRPLFSLSDDLDTWCCVQNALADIGEGYVSSGVGLESLLGLLHRPDSIDGECTLENLWLLLPNVFGDPDDAILRGIVSDKLLVQGLVVMLDCFSSIQLCIENPSHQVALTVLHRILKRSRKCRIPLYSLVKDVPALEKSLTAFCSQIMKAIHRLLDCYATEDVVHRPLHSRAQDEANISEPMAVGLKCVEDVLCLDLVLDKAAKRCLISLSGHDGGVMFGVLQRWEEESVPTSGHALSQAASIIAVTVNAALGQLPKFGVDAEVATALSVVEGVLSLDVAGFSASKSSMDIAIHSCMERIAQYLKSNDARVKFSLLDRRAGYFLQSASQALRQLSKKRLARTCDELLAKGLHGGDMEVLRKTRIVSADGGGQSYEPCLVLRMFLRACGEALRQPGSALLDIGRIAKDGILGVAISGLASDKEDVRSLSYACMHAFSELVGPMDGTQQGSASALYKDRKQLAFLLSLMMNSVKEPLVRVLPLFAVWFRLTLRVALTPNSPANKSVTYFFLRAPVMDVTDCLGVSHLLRTEVFGPELRATRMLALEILQRGVQTVDDVIVLRKRKLIGTLLMLGGSSCGLDNHVQGEVLNTLLQITSRDHRLGISRDLVLSHGLLSWLLLEMNNKWFADVRLKRKIGIIDHLCSAFSQQADSERYVTLFSRTLSALSKHLAMAQDWNQSNALLREVLACAKSVCGLAPFHRELVLIDSSLLPHIFPLCHDNGERNVDLALNVTKVVSRQNKYDIEPQLYALVLEVSGRPLKEKISATMANATVLDHQDAVEVVMAHMFVAQGLLHQRSTGPNGMYFGSNICLFLAEAMSRVPTVWLTIASICCLQVRGDLSDQLITQCERLPSAVPRTLNLAHDRRYCKVVDELATTIIEELVASSSSSNVQEGMAQATISQLDI